MSKSDFGFLLSAMAGTPLILLEAAGIISETTFLIGAACIFTMVGIMLVVHAVRWRRRRDKS